MRVDHRAFGRRVVEQIDRAAVAPVRKRVERHPQRVGVERVEEKDHEIPWRILGDARIAANDADVLAAQALAHVCEILPCDLVEAGRKLDAPDLLEGMGCGENHRAPEARADVDEGAAFDRVLRQHREHRAEIVDRYRFIVRRVCAGIADRIGIEVGEEEHGVRGNTVLVIKSSTAASRLSHA